MFTLTPFFARSATARLLAALLLISAVAPASVWAKKAPRSESARVDGRRNDTAYQYVSGVFDKLQTYWEKQAYEQRLSANALLTFSLNDQGELVNSRLNSAEDSVAGAEALAFLKQNAPFGRLPESLVGNRLEFNFKLTPGSLQMVSYRIVEDTRRDSVISYAAPASSAPPVASLFYARVVDRSETSKIGKVWEKPDSRLSDEEAMEQYIEAIRERIRQQWKQPENAVTFSPATALIHIDRDGSLLSATLTQSSGVKSIDKAILSTIEQAAPFKDAPDEVKSLPITLEYVFEPVVSTIFE